MFIMNTQAAGERPNRGVTFIDDIAVLGLDILEVSIREGRFGFTVSGARDDFERFLETWEKKYNRYNPDVVERDLGMKFSRDINPK